MPDQPAYDPYKNFPFRIKFDGSYAAGISQVSGLDGAGSRTEVTLKRGHTQDQNFQNWLNGRSSDHSPVKLLLHLFNNDGKLTAGYILHNCRVANYQFMQDVPGDFLIEHLTLAVDAFERDPAIGETPTPDFQ
jgi:hypothetical protein